MTQPLPALERFEDRLKHAMEAKNIGILSLSLKCEISPQILKIFLKDPTQPLTGSFNPMMSDYLALARVLRVPYDWLRFGAMAAGEAQKLPDTVDAM